MEAAYMRWIIGGLLCSCSFTTVLSVGTSDEIIKNGDFEYTNVARDWHCQGGCTLTSSKDAFSRYHSLHVTNRHASSNGPAQNVQLTPDRDYNFTAVIKLTKLPASAMYDSAELVLKCLTPEKPHGDYIKFGYVPMIPAGEWAEIGGARYVPAGAHGCHMYVQVVGASTEYLVDQISMHVLAPDTNWQTEANARIEKLRKADITVTLVGGHGENYDVEVKQTSSEFAFGSAVNAQAMYDPVYRKYQDFFYDNFEWAVLENALKWKQLEHTQNHVNFTKALTAIRALRSHGIKVRGHNLVWGIPRHTPSWLQTMDHAQIRTEVDAHIKETVGATKGLLEHWDVNNENLHGDWYEQVTHDPNITTEFFRQVHAIDPKVKLFLNDYGIVEVDYATAMRTQAKKFVAAGVPIYGVGVQSHFHSAHPRIGLVKVQLDTVAEAGLPIWITELSVYEDNATVKADALRDIMTLYFSHPAIEGVLLWGFWDKKIFHHSARLFEGPDLTPNAAGSVLQSLIKTTWRTHEHHAVMGDNSVKVRGFKGDYSLIVSHNGKHLTTETFTLDAAGKQITVNIGSGGVSTIVG